MESSTQPKTVILAGAGDRGNVYASYVKRHPDALRLVGVAEPVPARREKIAREHGIAPENVFESWEDMLAKPRMADGCMICTLDDMHAGPAVAAMEAGYQVLLEKPMAVTEKDCVGLVEASERTGRTLNICHVLRYTDFFSTIKKIVAEGLLGRVYSIYHAENVSYYHMAHSFVRGNWSNSHASSPMILAKCCHDLDILYWLAESLPRYVSSMGRFDHFTSEKAPEGAPLRCTDGCPVEKTCPYYAVDTYLYGIPLKLGVTKGDVQRDAMMARFLLKYPRMSRFVPVLRQYVDYRGWPVTAVTDDLTEEGIMKALRKGPYGRCVYFCDNDQVDHQFTMIEFESGLAAVLNMHGHSEQEGRTVRIDGSEATLRGKFGGGGRLEVHFHRTGEKKVYPVRTDVIGHSMGDEGLMENFSRVLNGGEALTTAKESLVSHVLALAAHRARIENRIIRMA